MPLKAIAVDNALALEVTAVPAISYTLSNLGLPVIPKLALTNTSAEPIEGLRLKITSALGTVLDFEHGIEAVPADSTIVVDCDSLAVNDALLYKYTEQSSDTLKIAVEQDGRTVIEASEKISIMPLDLWPGIALVESLAAFSTPNHPALPGVILRASEIIKAWTGSPALDAYQSESTQRARLQAAAVFMAIKERGIVYSEPPANFLAGQRIRLCHTVLDQHLGTCLDLTMLYVSCLEAIGLRPLVFLLQGHAFAGVWLEERCFPEILGSDPTDITNRFAQGVNQIAVVECTQLTNSTNTGFKEAEEAGRLNFLRQAEFACYLDIYRAHQGGILSLPLRLSDDGQYRFAAPAVDTSKGMDAPEASRSKTAVAADKDVTLTKTDLWERSLLDLSLRNNLLNMKIALRLTPLAVPNLPEMEDMLAKGLTLSLLPKPQEWSLEGRPSFEMADALGEHVGLLKSELAAGRLRTFLSEAELAKTMTNLLRVAKSSLEETGSSLLYLTIGALCWQRPGEPDRHYAPLILLPVEITRKSARAGFRLILRDDDPQVNISLLELLRRDYGIEITGLEPLPLDEFGIDVQMVFNTFRQKILQQPGWEVLEFAALGLFSFSQFVMWNDIRTNKERLLQSPVLQSLVAGRITWDAEPMRFDYRIDPLDLLLPISTDASQLFAINESLLGKSFVLHGPPGTGKSQTITGIIANALVNEKRVLFVSEKAAALNVVEKRLDDLGIGRFCLELHSNKASKAHVLGQLEQVIERHDTATVDEYTIAREKTRSIRSTLDQYALALHTVNSAGLSLRDQICRYEAVKSAPDGIAIDSTLLGQDPSRADLDERFLTIERLVAAAREIGDLSNHPLHRIKGGQFNYGSLAGLGPALAELKQAAVEHKAAGTVVAQAFGYAQPSTKGQWARLLGFSQAMRKWQGLPDAWAAEEALPALLRDVETLMSDYEALDAYQESYSQYFAPAFFDLDPAELGASWQAASAEGALKRKKAKQAVISRIQPFARQALDDNGVAFALQALRGLATSQATAASHLKMLEPWLGELTSLGTLDRGAVRQALEAAESVQGMIEAPAYLRPRQTVAGNAMLFSQLAAFVSSGERLQAAEKRVAETCGNIVVAEDEDWLLAICGFCESMPAHLDSFQEWSSWGQLAGRAEELKLDSVLAALYQGFAPDAVLPAYQKSLYREMCTRAFLESPVVGTFSGSTFNETIRQYKEAERLHRQRAKDELERRLNSRVPDLTTMAKKGSEAALLKRAIRSRGRGTSIRELFSQLPELLSRLCPCMLMSPLSVAQYLDTANEPFDLVIFDEASQLQTAKAVGALGRAKAAIVVGDPRQMPPTAFFQGQLSDEGYEGIADLESILDDCLALNLPETYLEWHYRSRHESLISFSNRQFYENKLSTFPSADDRASHVSYVKVEGSYDGKGENRAEAEAIVAELQRRYQYGEKSAGGAHGEPAAGGAGASGAGAGGAGASIGIVTFNVKQQGLIEDLLHEEFVKDPGFEEWTKAGDEPLFVKNLENVQGDERDVILFSITYAPDKDDKMAMRFGPINMDGGWRRLNVAVSRARVEMKVFASLDPERIDLGRTSAKGVRDLKSFLEFAKQGKSELVAATASAAAAADDVIADEICAELEAHGYKTLRNVGRSAFKVDIAVLGAEGTDEAFLAGLLLDGSTYAQAKTTRDREITQPGMLAALGWSTIRVWSIDWWANQQKTLEKVLAFLEETRVSAEQAAQATAAGQCVPEPGAAGVPEPGAAGVAEPGAAGAAEPGAAGVAAVPDMPEPYAASAVGIDAPEPYAAAAVGAVGIDAPEPAAASAAAAISAALAINATAAASTPGASQPAPLQGIDITQLRSNYQLVDLPLTDIGIDGYLGSHDTEIAERFAEVIAAEAPIEKQFLCNRVRESFGVGRSGKNIQERSEAILRRVPHQEAPRHDDVFVWGQDQQPGQYRNYRPNEPDGVQRSANQLPYEEIIAAMLEAIHLAGPLSRDALIRATSAKFGYQRVAARIISVFDSTIAQGLEQNQLALSGLGDIGLP